jgi:hypothetical protein
MYPLFLLCDGDLQFEFTEKDYEIIEEISDTQKSPRKRSKPEKKVHSRSYFILIPSQCVVSE